MQAVDIAQKIHDAIKEIGKEGQKSEGLINTKATTSADYDKQVAKAILTLKANGHPVSIIDKLARGECADALVAKILAEEMLKAHYAKMDRIKAQLNGLQSIYRHLDVS